MQSETGFPSSHQLESYVASKSRLKLAARCPVSRCWHSCFVTFSSMLFKFIHMYILIQKLVCLTFFSKCCWITICCVIINPFATRPLMLIGSEVSCHHWHWLHTEQWLHMRTLYFLFCFFFLLSSVSFFFPRLMSEVTGCRLCLLCISGTQDVLHLEWVCYCFGSSSSQLYSVNSQQYKLFTTAVWRALVFLCWTLSLEQFASLAAWTRRCSNSIWRLLFHCAFSPPAALMYIFSQFLTCSLVHLLVLCFYGRPME